MPAHPVSIARRYWPLWKQATELAAPVTAEKVLHTLMRTTDVLVAGLFSPAAVAAVGIGDSFSRIVNRAGLGIDDAAIALTSQDTGADAVRNRDEAVAQALLWACSLAFRFSCSGSRSAARRSRCWVQSALSSAWAHSISR